MELRLNAVDVKHFTVTNQYKLMYTDASDLRGYNLYQQLYDDAADVGFALWNAATNTVTRWHWAEERRDAEGELQVEYYLPTTETLRKYPQLAGWKVHIVND
jgi:hypothetical protein